MSSPFFWYSSTDETPSPTDEPPSPVDGLPMDEPPSPMAELPTDELPMDDLPTPTDEPPSPLLKSRIPKKTMLVDRNLFTDDTESRIHDLHCPLQKGIIYYRRDGAIFEHNIHSSRKHEPRIIVPKYGGRHLAKISFVRIKANQILLFTKYFVNKKFVTPSLHLSIHDIRPDNRIGPTLWSINGHVIGPFENDDLELVKSAENALGITIRLRFIDHWKLFDISIIGTDASDNFHLTESGRIDFDQKLIPKLGHHVALAISPDRHILLYAGLERGRPRYNETIDIHYSDSGGTNNMKFSFVSRMSIPTPRALSVINTPDFAFSANGSKFSMAMNLGRVCVWDIRSKVPLKTFVEVPKSNFHTPPVKYLQFSSGKLGKEVLAFAEHVGHPRLEIIHVIDATSFETEETLLLKSQNHNNYRRHIGVGGLFFDPSGRTMYAELYGTLYEWDLQKNEHGPEWWIGEE